MPGQPKKDKTGQSSGLAAVLIDGAFFLKRYYKLYPDAKNHTPEEVADNMYTMAMKHVQNSDLYRIFFYDCRPFDKKYQHPTTGKTINFAKTDQATFRIEFHEQLKRRRKLALRLGYLKDGHGWMIHPIELQKLLKGKTTLADLQDYHVKYRMKQSGVDMRIGVDIASLAYKKQVRQIILVAGDDDFVPAAKLARREGIDFVLDPMWNHINPSLFEHIDGLNSTAPKPKSQTKPKAGQ